MPTQFYTDNKRLTSKELIDFPLGGVQRGKARKFGAVVEEQDGTYTLRAGNQIISGLVLADMACFRDAMVELVRG